MLSQRSDSGQVYTSSSYLSTALSHNITDPFSASPPAGTVTSCFCTPWDHQSPHHTLRPSIAFHIISPGNSSACPRIHCRSYTVGRKSNARLWQAC